MKKATRTPEAGAADRLRMEAALRNAGVACLVGALLAEDTQHQVIDRMHIVNPDLADSSLQDSTP